MSSTNNFHELSKLSTTARQNLCKRTEADLSDFEAKVRPIMKAVADDGDVALARFATLILHAAGLSAGLLSGWKVAKTA